jgi:helicase
MKIKDLKKYDIPSCILNIWEKNPSPYLLPLQEDAVKNYGILSCGENLLVIAPTSSGKSFIGEMAAISQATHHKKIIYLLPLRSPAEEKYRHFKNLYSSYGVETVISTRNHREEDYRIIRGTYEIAVMAYEKFNYFLLKYPKLLDDVSLVIIDEMQAINHPKWGPLLEDIIEQLHEKELAHLRIIGLSAFIENQKALLKWFPIQTQTLLSYRYPVKLRKGMVRDGTFEYITSNKKNICICRKEIFFKPKSVRDNSFEDYLLETLKYLMKQGESTLIFFTTRAETRHWAELLASCLKFLTAPSASPSSPSSAPKDLAKMEETLSRDELLKPLKKGIAFYNQDLSYKERNLIETRFKKGEIKIICATATLSADINLPFKNVIIPLDKMHDNDNDENHPHNYRTSINFADIENMGGRAGILKIGNHQRQKFGRVIFLAHSCLSETIYENLYFKFLKNNKPDNNNNNNRPIKHLSKKGKDLSTHLLRLLLKYNFTPKKLKQYLKKEDAPSSSYWRLIFPKENIDEEINNCLHILKENNLIIKDSNGNLSLTPNGILIAAKRIKVETYLFLKAWLNYTKKGEISNLEILYLLSQTPDGKEIPIPFYHSSINDYKKESYKCDLEEIHAESILQLIFQQNEQHKKLYQEKIILKNCKQDEVFSLEEHLSFKKTLLLYDWIIGNENVKTIEQEYNLYQGAIYRLGEGFSWLADSLAAIAENANWKKKRKEDLNMIKLLSNRLILPSFPSTTSQLVSSLSSPPPCNSNDQRLTTILEIDTHRPDRIIFEGKEVKVTAREFSLIHLLAQHNEQVVSYEDIIKKLWGIRTEAIYTRIIQHIYYFRKNILDAIGNNKTNKEKVKDIFKVVSGRGVMLNINDTEIKIN